MYSTNKTVSDRLRELGAKQDAVDWAKQYGNDFKKAWDSSQDGTMLFDWANLSGVSPYLLVRIAFDFLERTEEFARPSIVAACNHAIKHMDCLNEAECPSGKEEAATVIENIQNDGGNYSDEEQMIMLSIVALGNTHRLVLADGVPDNISRIVVHKMCQGVFGVIASGREKAGKDDDKWTGTNALFAEAVRKRLDYMMVMPIAVNMKSTNSVN